MEEPSFSLAVDDFGVVGLFMEEEVEEGLEADAVFSLCFPELLAFEEDGVFAGTGGSAFGFAAELGLGLGFAAAADAGGGVSG